MALKNKNLSCGHLYNPMSTPSIPIEKKAERLRAHWLKVVGDASAKGLVTQELTMVLNELENPKIPVDILRIWIQLTAESAASPAVPPLIKSALLGSYLRNQLFLEAGTPQHESLEALLEFWKSVVLANRSNLQVAVQFAFKNLLTNEGNRAAQIERLNAVEELRFNIWGREFSSFAEMEAFFEEGVLAPLRKALASLPVDLQHFEIQVR